MQAFALLLTTTIIAGVLYPAVITGIGQLLLADQSNGSLIKSGDAIIGSKLISQQFNGHHYFWPRPSASNFNAVPSGATNLGPTSATLEKTIASRRSSLASVHGMPEQNIPVDLLTASASGLDPHISLASAHMQIMRIANARGLDENGQAKIKKAIDDQLEQPQFGILGEARVNVLLLNLAIDKCCQ